MMELAQGVAASVLFRDMLKKDPTLTGRDLSHLLAMQYPELDAGAIQLVRRWVGVRAQGGIPDSDLDTVMTELLRLSGYLKQ
jgi:hypothetical protein